MTKQAQGNKPHQTADSLFQKLVDVMAALRNPKCGCPWDLEQNFKTIAPYTIEEAYEVADAIDRHDMPALREELGDLLLQSVYHAQMANELQIFSIEDVLRDIIDKMIHRHPHVFGQESARNAEDVNIIWDERKDLEKKAGESALDGVPRSFPSLLRAQKIQKRAARTGFEWKDIKDALNKVHEELSEFESACKDMGTKAQMEELGDLLFAVSNLARMRGLNAEEALRQAIYKFETRFQGMEKTLAASDTVMKDLPLATLLKLWQKQKNIKA